MSGFGAVLRRDLRLAQRHGADAVMVVAFFVLAGVLFPLGVGPEPQILARIAGGIIWVGALLAAMLSLERIFLADYEDGGLDLLILHPGPLWLLVLAKTCAHWLTTGLPLILAAPILAVFLGLDFNAFAALIAGLALGTPGLSLIGAVGAALIIGARRGGVLLSLLILPLYVPILIFGTAAVEAAATGVTARPQLMILAAILLASLVLAPWAAAAGLKQSLD